MRVRRSVRVIEKRLHTLLVEWQADGRQWRAYVPTATVDNGQAWDDELQAGVPVGVDWEEHIMLDLTPLKIADALRERNIWTVEDLTSRLAEAKAAVHDACRIDWARILESVKREAKQ